MEQELKDITKKLSAVAMGREPAETVIKNTRLVNVNTGEILENTDIAVACGRIALVGDASHAIGEGTEVVDAAGMYAAPGFMDGHIHVESSMMTVREYARTVIPHGTTSIFPDPHEIANVLGRGGVRFMMDDARGTPLRVFMMMPSCVPAVPAFEDAGAALGPDDIADFMEMEGIYGLGEMMNFPGVLYGDENVHRELYAALAKGKTVTGHYSMPETGPGLNAYIASGVRCCHESVRHEDALAKMRLGMFAQIREGSAWRDLQEVVKAVTERRIDTRLATLVSDDTHPNTLISLGHMDHIVRRAVEEGVDPVTAVQMATINVAQCYRLDRDLGSLSPGKLADILLISDLARVDVKKVFIGGRLAAEDRKLSIAIEKTAAPAFVLNTCHLKKPLAPEDFRIAAPRGSAGTDRVRARVIEIIEARVGTRARECELAVEDGFVPAAPERDIAKLAVVERHRATGTMGKGFVKGFRLKGGAVASTVAHDAHNLMVVGTNDADMAAAGSALAECGGGMAAVKDGKILALLPLPIAGLMSGDSAPEIAARVMKLDEAWKALGCDLESPFMTMALLPLAVLPELRLTNRGLIDTVAYKFTDLFIDK
ncbi:MAG: adenine deaminase [Synergistaceae bacterium]|jgi:adenine deaminase|nr:adenine deaminase [Synergistaceae bacterium]